jgi:hypothetical protein
VAGKLAESGPQAPNRRRYKLLAILMVAASASLLTYIVARPEVPPEAEALFAKAMGHHDEPFPKRVSAARQLAERREAGRLIVEALLQVKRLRAAEGEDRRHHYAELAVTYAILKSLPKDAPPEVLHAITELLDETESAQWTVEEGMVIGRVTECQSPPIREVAREYLKQRLPIDNGWDAEAWRKDIHRPTSLPSTTTTASAATTTKWKPPVLTSRATAGTVRLDISYAKPTLTITLTNSGSTAITVDKDLVFGFFIQMFDEKREIIALNDHDIAVSPNPEPMKRWIVVKPGECVVRAVQLDRGVRRCIWAVGLYGQKGALRDQGNAWEVLGVPPQDAKPRVVLVAYDSVIAGIISAYASGVVPPSGQLLSADIEAKIDLQQ